MWAPQPSSLTFKNCNFSRGPISSTHELIDCWRQKESLIEFTFFLTKLVEYTYIKTSLCLLLFQKQQHWASQHNTYHTTSVKTCNKAMFTLASSYQIRFRQIRFCHLWWVTTTIPPVLFWVNPAHNWRVSRVHTTSRSKLQPCRRMNECFALTKEWVYYYLLELCDLLNSFEVGNFEQCQKWLYCIANSDSAESVSIFLESVLLQLKQCL